MLIAVALTILDGPLAGTTLRSDDAGRFEFKANSSGRVTLRASQDGFQAQTAMATWEPLAFAAEIGLPFWLESLEPPIGLELGAYTLTVAVDLANARDWKERPDAQCAGFPVEFATRSYRAEIKEAARPGFYTYSVTADNPTLRWHDLFAFFHRRKSCRVRHGRRRRRGTLRGFPRVPPSGDRRAHHAWRARGQQRGFGLDPLRSHQALSSPRETKMMRILNRGARCPSRAAVPAAVGRLCAASLVVALASISSCDKSPAAPSTAPAAGRPVTLSRVRIDGPTRVAPGDSPRYTAIAEYSDGSSKDVTDTAQWSPSHESFPMHFIGPGITAPAQRGEVTVAVNAGAIGRLTVMVLEPGTFKLSGPVSETGVGALSGVTVEVLSGIGQGLRAISNATGYALYGVAGSVRLRASVEGFTAQVADVVVTGNDATQAFALTPEEAVTDVSGIWTMTVSPATGCRPGLPDIARGRTYQVELIQTATRLKVKFSSPTLRQYNPDEHSGTVLGSRVRLLIVGDTDYGEWSTPDLYDQLSPTETFGFDGTVQGTVNGREIRGSMDGDLVYFRAGEYGPAWWCRSKDHIVTLRR